MRILLYILIILPLGLSAQNNDTSHWFHKKLSIGCGIVFTGENYTYTTNDKEANKWRDDLVTKPTVCIGLSLAYKLNKNNSFIAQIIRSSRGTDSDELDYTGNILGPKYDSTKYVFGRALYRLAYVDLVLGNQYFFHRDKSLLRRFYIAPTIEVNYFLKATMSYIETHDAVKGTYYSSHNNITDRDYYKKFALSTGLAIGFKDITESKTCGFWEIRYRQMLTSAIKGGTKVFPNSFGVFAGILYKL